MTEEQRRKYWQMFTDGWKLFAEFCEGEDTVEFWERFNVKAKGLDHEHSSKLFRDISIAIAEETEKIVQKTKGG